MTDSEDLSTLKRQSSDNPEYDSGASPKKSCKFEELLIAFGGNSQTHSQTQPSQELQLQNLSVQRDVVMVGRTLEVSRGRVFTELMEGFSEGILPERITYNGDRYNLTKLYDKFWKTFYNSPLCSRGHAIKIPQTQGLTDVELKSLARIIKRGWEDERYLPKKLAPPLLEWCLYQGSHSKEILSPKTFLKFIKPTEKAVIQNSKSVDQNVLHIFKKYGCENIANIGDGINDSFIKAAEKILIVDMKPVIDIWTQYLSNLMPVDTFSFLMKRPVLRLTSEIEDVPCYELPHDLWHTFFLGWPQDKITYYSRTLCNDQFRSKCMDCQGKPLDARHFISQCEVTRETMQMKRHDAVLKILETKLREAIKRGGPYFSKGKKWKVLTMYNNEYYRWPKEHLGVSFNNLYPHMLVYSLKPKKRILIVEITISWELWIDGWPSKFNKYLPVRKELKKKGFEVEYWVFKLGCRGVLIERLYHLLEKIFGMKHSEISKAMEDISQAIIHTHYKRYKKANLEEQSSDDESSDDESFCDFW